MQEIESMALGQNYRCAICKRDVSKEGMDNHNYSEHYGLHVDHSHKTGKIRGLLCQSCNAGLGRFGDNVENLMNAAFYLIKKGDS